MTSSLAVRIDHLRRAVGAYVLGRRSALDFWHETPAADRSALAAIPDGETLRYYMTFADKSRYRGPFDANGVPLLDYRATVGLQYNPIAVAQFALAWMNRELAGEGAARARWQPSADWLREGLVENDRGVPVWLHHFDWPYRETLRSPWFSGLAQGQGVSVLLRAWRLSGDETYREAAERAFLSFRRSVGEGGVVYLDERGDPWIEEYRVDPPSHILNGFLWALWGVWDMARIGGSEEAAALFGACTRTLVRNLDRYDTGYWSLYELGGTRLPMLASPFYHALHLVQLEVTARITGEAVFAKVAERWRGYAARRVNRARALALKSVFKLLYY